MKKILPLLILITSFKLHSQTFEIPSIKFPFYKIIEWKGIGAIALGRDPSLSQRQVDLVMVSSEGKSTWQQVYNPIVKDPYFIAEDGGKYAYFLENLELNDGKVYMHQLSSAGNIKVMNISFLTAAKSLGVSPSDLYLTDIITTQRALVWMFLYKNKETVKTISIAMTHHNFNLYPVVVSEVPVGKSKVEEQISWYIAGENGENIIYAARIHAGSSAGWLVKEFNPKGILVSSKELEQKGTNFMAHSRVGFGRRGSALLRRIEPNEKGTLIYANGNYYVGGVEAEGTNYFLNMYKLNGIKWEKHSQTPVTNFSEKKGLEVGVFNTAEGIGWFVQSTNAQGHLHLFDNPTGIVSGNIAQDTYNPSRLLTDKFVNKFIVELDTKWLIFDPAQLPSSGAIKFEYQQK